MSKILIFGATGQQGGSLVDYIIRDSELSKQLKVRAVTRDTSKPAAEALQQKGVEVVQGDADDKESLKHAMKDAHTVFAVTVSTYDQKLYERELGHGKVMADAAVEAGVQYYIFSSLSDVSSISGGKIKDAGAFDVKAEIERYIRTLPMKSAFFTPGYFMQNLSNPMRQRPRPAGDGTYVIANFVKPDTQLPLIDTVDDAGKYVGAILAEPEKYEGKVFSAATRLYTYTEIVETMSKMSGKTVRYEQLPLEVWKGFLPPIIGINQAGMFQWAQDFGYYGPNTKTEVEWTAQQARGKLTTLEVS